ncbi:MAG: PrpR N-terminal domain-containing protein [Paenibacillus dendritiformis]|uniref:sigma-54-dependent transcriptional regulator n=1 Tax=uncultured Paenibacillus sp. TaxID=227322 RepID=UPI0025D0C39F|nr:sigma-54-dependent transcriptional regulator [uncultured Paenibacillus sp.]MDU5143339.1 PrpR N-terminal domain-containing protein [Paenibacillus dendritiformis]
MTIKTLVIAPYPAMTPLIEECRSEDRELDIRIEVGNLQEAVPIAREAERQGFDIIISRGGTAKLIEPEVGIPVIDVHVSGYDMLRVLTLTNDFPGKKAIVGFANITLGAKAIADVLDIGVEVCTVEEAGEVESILAELKRKGYELIIGDVVTVEAAAKHQQKGILIQSGREAIFEAFHKAKSIYRLYRRQQWDIAFLRSLLTETASDLIVLGQQGEILLEQWTSHVACPVPIDELVADIRQDPHTENLLAIRASETGKFKQRRVRKEILGKTYYLFSFSSLPEKGAREVCPVEEVSRLPVILAESEAMSRCLRAIDGRLDGGCFILIGEAGSGKQLLSRYIHVKKHGGRGLYACLTARQALTELAVLDSDILTVYINGLEQLEREDALRLQTLIREQADTRPAIVVALEREERVYQGLLFDEGNVRVSVPPLRERKEDIKPLAAYYIADFHGTLGTSPVKLKEDAIELLESYPWPGNAAELQALLKDAVTAEKGYVIGKTQLTRLLDAKRARPNAPAPLPRDFLEGTLDEIEKRIIHAIMKEEHDNQTRVAERLGINRSTLWRKLKQ